MKKILIIGLLGLLLPLSMTAQFRGGVALTQAQVDSMARLDASGNLKGAAINTWGTPAVSNPTSTQKTLTTSMLNGLLTEATQSDSVVLFDHATKAYKKKIASSFGGKLTAESLSATGTATAWNSIVTVGSASANVTTLPVITTADIGKTITIKNVSTGVNTQLAPAGATMVGGVSLKNGESVTFVAYDLTVIQAISDKLTPIDGTNPLTTIYNYNNSYDTINNYVFVNERRHLNFSGGVGVAFIKDGQIFGWGNIWKTQTAAGAVNTAWNITHSQYKANGTLITYTPFFKKIAYTSENIVAIDQYGKVWIAGTDTWGQLGDGATTGRANNVLYLVEYFSTNNIDVVDIVANGVAGRGSYWYALSSTGIAYFCGYNNYGQAGDNTTTDKTTPQPLTLAAPVAKICTGGKGFGVDGYQTFFIFTNSTTPQALGHNPLSQLGDGTVLPRNVPTTIPTLAGATDIQCGGSYTAAIFGNTASNVKFAGANTYGAFGTGNTTASTTFTNATSFTGVASKIYISQSLSAQSLSTIIIDTARQVWVAGLNFQGYLGEGVATAQSNILNFIKPNAPFQGKALEVVWAGTTAPVTAIRDTTGDVYAAGYNGDGAKGQGNATTTFLYQNTWHKVGLPNASCKILSGGTPESSGAAFYSVNKLGQIYQWGWSGSMATTSNGAWSIYAPKYVLLDQVAKTRDTLYIGNNNTYQNGLTKTANLVELGGTLSKNTDIATAGFNATFSGTGNVGIGTTTPISKLDVQGSLGLNRTTSAAAAYIILPTDLVVNLSLAGAQTVTLPAAASFSRRVLKIVNPTATVKTLGTAYTTIFGFTSTVMQANSWVEIQSDGTVWQEVSSSQNLYQISLTGAQGLSLGGVTFTTNNIDPLSLTTSLAATGYIMSEITPTAAGATPDGWTTTATSGAGASLLRGRSWNGVTTGFIGISSAAYCHKSHGVLTANGRTFEVRSYSYNGTHQTVIKIIK